MSSGDSQNQITLHGIPISPEQIRRGLQETIDNLPGQDPDHLLGACAVLASGLEILDEIEPVPTENVDAALDRERYRYGIAAAALDAVERAAATHGTSVVNKDNPLLKHRKKPLQDAVDEEKRQEEQAKLKAAQEMRKEEIAQHEQDIDKINTKYVPTGSFLRDKKYEAEGKQVNGMGLSQAVSQILDSGSQTPIFSDGEARVLSGLALGRVSHREMADFKRDLQSLARLHRQMQVLGHTGASRLVLNAYSKLSELYESDSLALKRPLLEPVRRWIEVAEKDDRELFEHFVDTLSTGPFADCEQLYIAPFEGIELPRSKATVVIDKDAANETNIKTDIELAVKSSSGAYIVEDERIKEFIILKDKFIGIYGEQAVRILRTLRPKWHPLPWYGILVDTPNETSPPLLVLETPIHNNATYCVADKEWPAIIEHIRTEAQLLGAAASNHTELRGHSDKVFAKAQTLVRRNTK